MALHWVELAIPLWIVWILWLSILLREIVARVAIFVLPDITVLLAMPFLK